MSPVSFLIIILTALQFLCDCIDRKMDICLIELRTGLIEVCSTEASLQTVAQSGPWA